MSPTPPLEHPHNHGGHGHDHHHHGSASRRALTIALVLNGAFMFVEAGVGWYTGSLALLSDAVHMVSDVGALALALWAAHLASRPASRTGSFGMVRAEVLGAFANALLLLIAAFFIFKEAVMRLTEGGHEVAGVPVLIAGVIGLAINVGSAWALTRGDSDNLNIRGALAHMLADALGSVGAIVAALGVMYGYPMADPIAAMLIAALVLWGTVGLAKDSARVLLQFAPRGVSVEAIEAALRQIPQVCDLHELHVWTLGGNDGVLTAHLVVSEDSDVAAVRAEAAALLVGRFGLRHTTLQIERLPVETCPQGSCVLLEREGPTAHPPHPPSEAHHHGL